MTVRTYAQFFNVIANDNPLVTPVLIEACGDRSVIILDGRIRRAVMHDIAKIECERRGYEAYQLLCGQFRASGDTVLSPIIKVKDYEKTIMQLMRAGGL